VSNIVYEDKMYNEDEKRKFINNYKESTQPTVERIFKVSQTVESSLDKDLYNFNREQLRKLLFLFMPKTEKSSQANVAWINSYISWAIDEGYRNGVNPLDGIPRDWSSQFVVKGVKLYWTDEEMNEIVRTRKNAADAVIIELLRSGIRGTANSEITNLKAEHINFDTNTLTLHDSNGTTRQVVVSQECIDMCQRALKEFEYEKMNGKPNPDIKAPFAQLVSNNYVVKSVNTRTDHHNDAEKNVVHRRLKSISNELSEPNFTPLNLVASGMLSLAHKLMIKNGKFEDEEVEQVLEQFGEDKSYSATRLKNEFLNESTIRSLYKLT
jgi:integrase